MTFYRKCVLHVLYKSLLFLVSLSGMGHGDSGGQEPDQSNVDRQPPEEDQVGRSSKAPLDLRTNKANS